MKSGQFSAAAGTKDPGKPSGADWENLITDKYNKIVGGTDKEASANAAKFYPEYGEAALATATSFNKKLKMTTPMKQYGGGGGKANLSESWKAWGGTNGTPKTDMYIGRQHISLKKFGGSQLMSGGKAETLATLAYAYDRAPNKVKTQEMDKAWSAMSKQIESQYMKTQLPTGRKIGDVKKDIKTGKLSSLESASFTTLIKNTLQNNNAMTVALNAILEKDEIKKAVIHEAISGRDKFSTRLARASHMMVFSPAGSAEYKAINKSLVNHYASQTTFNISFKTGGTGKGA